MATPITTTPQDITGDFDLTVRGSGPSASSKVTIERSLGSSTTNWETLESLDIPFSGWAKNQGTNSFRLRESVQGVTVEFEQ